MISIARRRLAAALAGLPAALPARAQERYPSRPIRAVVPFTAGSSTDLRARSFGHHMTADWGQPVVVENRPGGNGVIAAETVARARPDGYTLLYGTNSTHAANIALVPNLPYDPVADFAPVTLVTNSSLIVVVNNALPVRSMAELIAYARAHPGRLNYAVGNTGSMAGGAMLRALAGIEMTQVSYRSTPQGVTALLAGEVQLMVVDGGQVLVHVREGRLRALATTGTEPHPGLPELPLVSSLPGMENYAVSSWIGLFAPAGTPRPVILQLNAKMREIAARPDMQAQIAAEGSSYRVGSPEDLAGFVRREIEDWRRLVREGQLSAG